MATIPHIPKPAARPPIKPPPTKFGPGAGSQPKMAAAVRGQNVPPPPTRFGPAPAAGAKGAAQPKIAPRLQPPPHRPSGRATIQRMESQTISLLKDESESSGHYGTLRATKTYRFRKDGPAKAPTKPKFKGGEPPTLSKELLSAGYQIVTATVGDGINIRGEYKAFSAEDQELSQQEVFLNGDVRTYRETRGFLCCKTTIDVEVAMVDYVQADPPQQGIGAILIYILARVLESSGITMIASGTDTRAALGLLTAMGAHPAQAPGGFNADREEGTVNFFRANPSAAKTSAAVKFGQSGWTEFF